MRYALIAFWLSLFPLTPAYAQLSINFGSPGVSIGVNFGVYPTLQRVPGYPVYYAPGVNTNYFFYDGLYWVYEADSWYASSWYNGPWRMVDPFDVPVYVLRVPVRYYRHAPAYFRGWNASEAPRWGDHWGSSWQQRRSGWDRWDRKSAPAPAPLPTYQRQYSGNRYPQASQQAVIETRNYRYQPRDAVARQHFEYQRSEARSAPQPAQRSQPAPRPQPQQRQPQAPRQQPQVQRQQPQAQRQQPQQSQPAQRPQPQQSQPAQRPQPQQQQRAAPAREEARGKGQDKDDKDKGKGRER